MNGYILLILSVGIIGMFITLMIVREGKENGRHRGTAQAHRTGTDRGADASDGTSGGASGAGEGTGDDVDEEDEPAQPVTFARGGIVVSGRRVAGNLIANPVPQPPPVNEFGGVGFGVGVVRGTRSFEVDKLGRLTGVSFTVPWTMGENEAKCLVRPFAYMMFQGVIAGYLQAGDGKDEIHESEKPPHSLTECQHGFYAYYEGSDDYRDGNRISGVIEGYGEVIVGTRGFRAMKARIVALHIPSHLGHTMFGRVQRNYPEIPVFDTFEKMVAEFPPDDAGLGLTPDKDPDFWTRPI